MSALVGTLLSIVQMDAPVARARGASELLEKVIDATFRCAPHEMPRGRALGDGQPMSDKPMKPSRDYSTMTREEAAQHFQDRINAVKGDIRALPLAEKFRLVADFIEAGDQANPVLTLTLAKLALQELEAGL